MCGQSGTFDPNWDDLDLYQKHMLSVESYNLKNIAQINAKITGIG
jgi:hypothetical protein